MQHPASPPAALRTCTQQRSRAATSITPSEPLACGDACGRRHGETRAMHAGAVGSGVNGLPPAPRQSPPPPPPPRPRRFRPSIGYNRRSRPAGRPDDGLTHPPPPGTGRPGPPSGRHGAAPRPPAPAMRLARRVAAAARPEGGAHRPVTARAARADWEQWPPAKVLCRCSRLQPGCCAPAGRARRPLGPRVGARGRVTARRYALRAPGRPRAGASRAPPAPGRPAAPRPSPSRRARAPPPAGPPAPAGRRRLAGSSGLRRGLGEGSFAGGGGGRARVGGACGKGGRGRV